MGEKLVFTDGDLTEVMAVMNWDLQVAFCEHPSLYLPTNVVNLPTTIVDLLLAGLYIGQLKFSIS